MASGDARWPPLKNTAWRVTFPVLDADGDLVTSAGTPDSERSIDGGTFADCSNEAIEIATASGMYYLDLNASEMNGDCISVIVKSTNGKTTPIVVYPASGGFTNIVSDIAAISTKVDSDSVLYLADHDKTQSDLALAGYVLSLDHDKTQSDIALIDAAIDSDSILYLADHDKTQSDIALVAGDASAANQTAIISDILLLSGKLDSDMVLDAADHDKTQSDIALIDAAIDSDSTLYLADHDKTQSDIADLSTKQDSDMVIVASDTTVNATKQDSDMVLLAADHDKTQSDVTDLSTKQDSDMVIVASDSTLIATKQDSDMVLLAADHDKTQSDIALVDAAIDSDSVLYLADHDKTQSDIALGLLGTGQVSAWASALEASAGTIKEGVAKAGTLSTTQMSTTLTEVNDVFNGRILIFKTDTTTAALRLQATAISDYANVNGVLTFTAVTTAPSATETFVIV